MGHPKPLALQRDVNSKKANNRMTV